jgi:uncharacterized protein (DUF58 family)
MRAACAARWSNLQRLAERRLPALTRLKQAEPMPILLHRRRIYVIPSRFGLVYSLMLIVMLIGSLNYANNPALLLTCLLGAASYQSVFAGFRTLNRVELKSIRAEPCHAGDLLSVSLRFGSAAATAKYSLRLRMDNAGAEPANAFSVFDLPAAGTQDVVAALPTARRGWLPLGRVRLCTEYPYGLFHVWSWLHPEQRALIYPRLEADPPPLPLSGSQTQTRAVNRDEDESELLREYRAGDPRGRIAWKASARQDHLFVKQFETRRGHAVVLAWDRLAGLDAEARISRLAAWIERAEIQRIAYCLELPQTRLGPALGPAHRHACLRELALLPGAET